MESLIKVVALCSGIEGGIEGLAEQPVQLDNEVLQFGSSEQPSEFAGAQKIISIVRKGSKAWFGEEGLIKDGAEHMKNSAGNPAFTLTSSKMTINQTDYPDHIQIAVKSMSNQSAEIYLTCYLSGYHMLLTLGGSNKIFTRPATKLFKEFETHKVWGENVVYIDTQGNEIKNDLVRFK